MRPVFFILLFLQFLNLSSCRSDSCEKVQKEIRSLMGDLYQKKIKFPADMEALNAAAKDFNMDSTGAHQTRNGFTIVHFFKADCDKCLHELSQIKSFLALKEQNKLVNYLFIASAPTKVYVLDAIQQLDFNYPVYYEKIYYSFKSINGLSLEDDLYNTSLLNHDNEVLLFGAFYNNAKAEQLFFQTVKCGP